MLRVTFTIRGIRASPGNQGDWSQSASFVDAVSRAPSGSRSRSGEIAGKDAGDRSRVRAKSRIACGSIPDRVRVDGTHPSRRRLRRSVCAAQCRAIGHAILQAVSDCAEDSSQRGAATERGRTGLLQEQAYGSGDSTFCGNEPVAFESFIRTRRLVDNPIHRKNSS